MPTFMIHCFVQNGGQFSVAVLQFAKKDNYIKLQLLYKIIIKTKNVCMCIFVYANSMIKLLWKK